MHSTHTLWRFIALALFFLSACAEIPDEEDIELSEHSSELSGGTQLFATVTAGGTRVTDVGSTLPSASFRVVPTRLAVGVYSVDLVGLAARDPTAPGRAGTAHVVAIGGDNVRCALAGPWTFAGDTVRLRVECRKPSGARVHSTFALQYGVLPSAPRAHYTLVEASGAAPSAFNFSTSSGTTTVAHPERGVYRVLVRGLAALQDSALQVTSVDPARHCHAQARTYRLFLGEEVRVLCFDEAGALADAPFTFSLADRGALSLSGVGAFAELDASGTLTPRSINTCPLGNTVAVREGRGAYRITRTRLTGSTVSDIVSAFAGTSHYCKLRELPRLSASQVEVSISCFDASGATADIAFVDSLGTAQGSCACPETCTVCSPSTGVCPIATLASSTVPSSVTADATTVYWTHSDPTALMGHGLRSVPRSGGAATVLSASPTPAVIAAHSLALAGGVARWVERGATSEALVELDLSSTPVPAPTSRCTSELPIPQTQAVVTVGATQYWAASGANRLYSVSSSTCAQILMDPPSSLNSYPAALTADAARLYFLNDRGTRVHSLPFSGGASTVLTTAGTGGLGTRAIASDGRNVFFASSSMGNVIYRISGSGGATSVVARSESPVTGLAYSDGLLFWTERAGGAVKAIHPDTGEGVFTVSSSEDSPGPIYADSFSVIWGNANALRTMPR